jgi:hypothetical protein
VSYLSHSVYIAVVEVESSCVVTPITVGMVP